MNKNLNIRLDDDTFKLIELLKKELGTNKSNVIRMSVLQFYKQVKNMQNN